MNQERTPNLKPETKRMIAALVGELLGTMFLVFIATGIQVNRRAWSRCHHCAHAVLPLPAPVMLGAVTGAYPLQKTKD